MTAIFLAVAAVIGADPLTGWTTSAGALNYVRVISTSPTAAWRPGGEQSAPPPGREHERLSAVQQRADQRAAQARADKYERGRRAVLSLSGALTGGGEPGEILRIARGIQGWVDLADGEPDWDRRMAAVELLRSNRTWNSARWRRVEDRAVQALADLAEFHAYLVEQGGGS